MAETDARWRDGGCLCGAVRFAAKPRTDEIHVCYCSMCRRWSAGPFFCVDCGDDVRLEPSAPVGVFRSSDWAERVFCRECGSTLIWRMHDGSHNGVSVEAFDPGAPFALASEIFVDEQPEHTRLAAVVPRMTGAEVIAQFQAARENTNG